jgi:hypothetical protein
MNRRCADDDLTRFLEAGDQRILAILIAAEKQDEWLAGYLDYDDADALLG